MAGCTTISLGLDSPIMVKPGACLQVPTPPVERHAPNHVLASVLSSKTGGPPIEVHYCPQDWGRSKPTRDIPGDTQYLNAPNGGSISLNAGYPNAFALIDTCPVQTRLRKTAF